MISYKPASTTDELQQILALQKANLPTNVSVQEQLKEGFVTVHHDLDLLTRMNTACAHTIAKDGEQVIGYALSMHSSFGEEIEVLRPMFAQIDAHIPPDTAYIVMGQICLVFCSLYRHGTNMH